MRPSCSGAVKVAVKAPSGMCRVVEKPMAVSPSTSEHSRSSTFVGTSLNAPAVALIAIAPAPFEPGFAEGCVNRTLYDTPGSNDSIPSGSSTAHGTASESPSLVTPAATTA